jgi:hypothetical protein
MDKLNDVQKEMIQNFQCSGCMSGSDTNCGCFELREHDSNGSFYCHKQYAGTTFLPGGKVYLGLPKGFNKVGDISNDVNNKRTTNIRLFENDSVVKQTYNFLNIPVWAMQQDGYLFIRCYSPRVNISYVDVIKGGILQEICPKALDVADFIDEID